MIGAFSLFFFSLSSPYFFPASLKSRGSNEIHESWFIIMVGYDTFYADLTRTLRSGHWAREFSNGLIPTIVKDI